ncbi:hypothetical protein ACFP81_00840 [Deinococcus lacus]|uniref:Uncharacterized protein n=1 Tax=Deinococcus lacus TaxID=392561 RepID=A0ABW1Y959_9DEIO
MSAPALRAALDRWKQSYDAATPLGKTWRELGLLYLGYLLVAPLTFLVPNLSMSEDNAAGISELLPQDLSGPQLWLTLAGFLALLSVVAPLGEELVFRGLPLLLLLLLRRWTRPPRWVPWTLGVFRRCCLRLRIIRFPPGPCRCRSFGWGCWPGTRPLAGACATPSCCTASTTA